MKHAAAPLFNDLDAADTLDELLAIQASSENQDRLAACEFGVPSWWHEFKRRFADRKRELEARETASGRKGRGLRNWRSDRENITSR